MDLEAKKDALVDIRSRADSSDSSTQSSNKSTLRMPRFAEATSVNSPLEPAPAMQLHLPRPLTNTYQPQLQPHDVGFGYIGNADSANGRLAPGVEMPLTPFTPLKSAMRTPGAPPRNFDNPFSPTFQDNPLSPTFKEEQALEQREGHTDKEQAKDLVRFHAGCPGFFWGFSTNEYCYRKSKFESDLRRLYCAAPTSHAVSLCYR